MNSNNMLFQSGNQFHSEKKDLRVTKADLKAEIHFIGQIIGGLDFATSDGLFCEVAIDAGDGWELLQPGANKGIQTQTSYANPGSMFVWNHPFDLHYSINNWQGWPKALVKVWHLDASNKIDACSYGNIIFPRTKGWHQITCDTWTPTGENIESGDYMNRTMDLKFQNLAFYMNNQPRLTTLSPLTTEKGDYARRQIINSITSGKIMFEIEVLTKNFQSVGISYKEKK